MRILLDENVPIQVLPILRRVLVDHVIEHVESIGWKGKEDLALLQDAGGKGYDVIVTKDRSQLADPEECKAIKRSRLHQRSVPARTRAQGVGAGNRRRSRCSA